MPTFRSIRFAVVAASLLVAGGASAQSMSSVYGREGFQQDRFQDGRRDSWGRDRDGWGRDRGNHYGWDRGNHNGWGNGWDHREGRNDGRHDGWDRGNHYGWDRGNHNGWGRGGNSWDHREGMNYGHYNGWNRGAGGSPGFGGQSHQRGMPGGMQNARGGQYGGGHSGWSANRTGMQPHMQSGGGQYGRPNYGGFTRGGMQNAGGQFARPAYSGYTRSTMATAPSHSTMPTRTASAGGRSFGGGRHR